MNKIQTIADNTRFEKKFMAPGYTIHEIEAFVNLHPAIFSQIYHPRFVNNLYLDSLSLNNYFSHVNGLKDRVKVRIRWYGDLFGPIDEPVLELKIKRGSLGRKESFPLPSFRMDENLNLDAIKDLFSRSDIPEALGFDLLSLESSLLNRYRRKYYQSADRKYRLTIDSEMAFYQIHNANNSFLRKSNVLVDTILELKYAVQADRDVGRITNHFPFRLARISKYISGVERIYLW